MPGKKTSKTMTPAKRSKKAHIAPPQREIAPHLSQPHHEEGDVGQFSEAGQPPLQKK